MEFNSPVSLPPRYEENTLILMVHCPRTLYAYWELSSNQMKALTGKGTLRLKLTLINRGIFYSYDLQPLGKCFYFPGVEPGRGYYCEIGVVGDNNEFYSLISSNMVHTPPEKPGELDLASSSGYEWRG